MKRLLLAPAIALPFFLISCGQPGWPGGPGDSGGERPAFPSDGSGTTMERREAPANQDVGTATDGLSSKNSTPSSYQPERTRQQRRQQRERLRADTSTSAS